MREIDRQQWAGIDHHTAPDQQMPRAGVLSRSTQSSILQDRDIILDDSG